MVPGELWTLRDLFVLPNEYVYWSIQIVMYPFMTGLVAGAFVLSSLYHVFGIKQLRDIARFALVFSFALLPGALVPLLLHLQHPFRGINVLMTPHFTSAIAAFGIVFSTYFMIVASELWFIYRRHFVQESLLLRKPHKTIRERVYSVVYTTLTLGAYDTSEKALRTDEKATRILAAAGIPVALFLHGYAGFIFGSVKANALWMTPLMPVIFIVSAVVSGIAFCMLTYILAMEIRKLRAGRKSRAAEPREAPRGDRRRRGRRHPDHVEVPRRLPAARHGSRASRPRLPPVHGGQVMGRPEERRVRPRVQAGLPPAVRPRRPRAADPLPDPPAQRQTSRRRRRARPVRHLHDALERRHRRAVVLPHPRRLHALRAADRPDVLGDGEGRGGRRDRRPRSSPSLLFYLLVKICPVFAPPETR